jgi:hypothetical protein
MGTITLKINPITSVHYRIEAVDGKLLCITHDGRSIDITGLFCNLVENTVLLGNIVPVADVLLRPVGK